MKKAYFLSLFILIIFSAFTPEKIEKAEFYKALSGGVEESIDRVIQKLEGEKETALVSAYKGALLMKKAGFVKGVNGKVKTFKKGAKLLEAEIKSDPENAEFRFLRLAVQEHAPGILKYNKNLDEDKTVVIKAYEKFDSALKSIVSAYAGSSKIIKLSDLK